MKKIKECKWYQIALFVVGCLLINYYGKSIAASMGWPLWFDAIGTILAAYALGPLCGVMVGLACNLGYGISDPVSIIYGLTSVGIAVSTGLYTRKKSFDDFYTTVTCSVIVTLVSVVISTPLNILLFAGYTGNVWGDGVINFFFERNVPYNLCCFLGEFYVDFADKLISIHIIFVCIRITNLIIKKKNGKKIKVKKTVLPIILAISLLAAPISSMADEEDETKTENPRVEKSSDYNTYVQTIFNADNKIPCAEANAIAETVDGIIWIGTYAGLYRFNGSEMKLMDEFESVKNVNCLYVDEEGRLWIGTNDSGVSVYINGQIVDTIDDTDGLTANSIRCITRGTDGYYYIGTSESLHIVSISGGLKIQKTLNINYACSVSEFNNGDIAVVSGNGEVNILRNQEIAYKYKLSNGNEQYTSCAFDKEGLLYLGSSLNHVYVYEVGEDDLKLKKKYTCGNLENINSVNFYNGEVYLCSDTGIGYIDSMKKYHSLNTDPFNNSVDNMLVDYQGNKWFTSSRMGVMRLTESDFSNIFSVIGVKEQVVNSMTRNGDLLYIGTDKGLVIIDLKRKKQIENELTEFLDGTRIRCIRFDSKDNLWICSYGNGLIEVSGDDITFFNSETGAFGNRSRVVIETSDGVIAAAGENGISFIEDGKLTNSITEEDGLVNSMILSLMEWDEGTILAGTDGSGIVVVKNGMVQRVITKTDGLSSDVILRTVKDSVYGGVYIVTSNGLCYMSADGEISKLDKFPYFNNYDMWEAGDGRLFILGSAGIYVTDVKSFLDDDNPEFHLLETKAGLTSSITANSWNYIDEEGYLYISCDSGVFRLNTNDYGGIKRSYRMLVSSIKIDDQYTKVETGNAIYLERTANKMEIFPEVINYSTDDPYVTYYLEGFDSSETTVLQSDLTSIVYTNLPPGTYTFHLEVKDPRDNEAIESRTYTIIKDMAIQDNEWFLYYIIIVVVLGVAWFTWFFVRTGVQPVLEMQKKEIEISRKQIEMGNETILAIARTVDAKDSNTSDHSQRVAEYSVLIARELDMSEEECERLKKTALLHDIGKIGIPDKVLNKNGPLEDDEYAIMKTHVERGAEILKDFTLIDKVWEGALYHHERYDGKGYASGLAGKEIPISARIIGIADAFDAMTANRVYRKRLPFDYVLGEINKGRGTQFDPYLVDILLKLVKEGKISKERIYGENTDGDK